MSVNNNIHKKARTFAQLLKMSSTDTNTLGTLNDPLFYEFIPIFHFDAPSGLLANETFTNSALAHLRRIGEIDRYNTLKAVIDLLKRLSDDAPWMFHSIAGLDEVKQRVDEPILLDRQLSIEMFNTVDWRSNALVQMIKSVMFDYSRKVEVLPRNLQRFSMSVLIRDARVFSPSPNDSNFVKRFFGEDSNDLAINADSINHHLFHLGKVRFLESSGEVQFGDLRNDEYTDKMSNLDIEYRVVQESAMFRAITGNLPIQSNTKNLPLTRVYENVTGRFSAITNQIQRIDRFARDLTDFNAISNNLQNTAERFGADSIEYVGRSVEGSINRVLLNNVYDRDINDFFRLIDSSTVQRTNIYLG